MNEDIEKYYKEYFDAVGEMGIKNGQSKNCWERISNMSTNPLKYIENEIHSLRKQFLSLIEEEMFDLLMNEVDYSIKDKLCEGVPKMEIFKSISLQNKLRILQSEQRIYPLELDYSKDGFISATVYDPIIIGFIDTSLKKVYVRDSLKRKFCGKNNLCQKDSCNSCSSFVCNIDGNDILRAIQE